MKKGSTPMTLFKLARPPRPCPAPAPLSGLRAATASSFLLVAASLFLTPAAHAGSWQFSCTGSGSSTYAEVSNGVSKTLASTTWTPPSAFTGTFYSMSGLSYPLVTTIGTTGTTEKEDISVNAVITLTWTHAAGQTDATDPAPPSVILIETSGAKWTGGSALRMTALRTQKFPLSATA